MVTLAKFFLDNKKFTLVLTLGLIVFGVGGLARINSESFPAVDFAMATVVTVYDGASAEDIETKITKEIEDELRTVTGIKDVRSVSQPGLSTIYIRGDIDNVDVPKLMSDLQRAVDRAEMPPDLEDPPLFTEIKSEEFPVVEIAVVGNNQNRHRDIAADLLKEDIEDLDNILEVRPVGYRERAFQVYLDRKLMIDQHVGVNEVVDALKMRNVNIPGGSLETKINQKLLRIEGKIENKRDLENVLVRSNSSGQQIYLKDIATVLDDMEEPKVLARHNGEDATLLIATKKAGADTIELEAQVDAILENYRDKFQGSLRFEVFNNEALRVKNRVAVLASNAVSGFILVIVFLLIFLPGRIGIVASLSLPIAVLVAIGFMPVFGMNLDAVTILALVIAIGMLVDNSVVISENYARLRAGGMEAREAILNSIQTLWLPISATAFTTIAAFLPMLATKGIMGEFIKFIPIIVTIALVMSLVESFFFLPMRLEGISAKKKTTQSDWFQRRLIPFFERFVNYCVRYRYASAGAFTLLIVLAFVMMGYFNKFILFPPEQTEIYAARVEMPKGTRVEETHEEMSLLSKHIREKLGDKVEHIVARSGISTMGPNDPKEKESHDVGIIMLYVNNDTRDNVPHTEILASLREIKLPRATVQYEALINGPPVGDPVNATFRSNNSESLDDVIQGIMAKLRETEGVRDVKVQDVFGDEEIHVNINYAKADVLGLDVDSVGNAIRAAVAGKTVSDVNLNNKEVDLVVRLKGDYRRTVEDLKNLEVLGRDGFLIPLGSFVEFDPTPGAPYIKRFKYKRSRTVTANIDDTVISSIDANQVVKDAFAQLRNNHKDVTLVFGGEEENTKESMDSLWDALVLSLIGIFALLVFLFNSYLRPAIIMSTIPLGLVGFSIAFALHSRPISFLAMIGVIGLGGIIVNSGIVLITFIDELRAEGKLEFGEALVKASGMRLRAVVVSSLTTISGLLPTAYGIGGSDSILIPMTLAMAWGLTSGTILTLIWVPCAYAIIEDITKLNDRVWKRVSNFIKPSPREAA